MQFTSELYADSRPNVFEIDLHSIVSAFSAIRRRVGPGVKIFAALKANAYGFGLEPVARCLVDAGADALAVVDRAHAIAMRHSGITAPILVYPNDVISADVVQSCERWDLIPTVIDRGSAELLSRYASRTMAIAVKLDVGQERLGVPAEDAAPFLAFVCSLPKLELAIVNAHASVPTDSIEACLSWEFERFVAACDAATGAGVRIPTRLFASSKSLRVTSAIALDAVDPGNMLFPTTAIQALRSRLIHARVIDRERFLDQAPFPLRKGMRYGVIPMGSADGLPACTASEVLVRGRHCPIVGQPSLEYTRIDLTEVADAAVGDEVVLIGHQGGAAITPEEVMLRCGHAQAADIAMAIRDTVRRVHLTLNPASQP